MTETPLDCIESDSALALDIMRSQICGCREELENGDKCWAPAEFVLWGKLIPAEGLGPRCYDHAVRHVGHPALRPESGHAVIHLGYLAYGIATALGQERSDAG